MKIGPYILDNPLILAPMAGVTDRPFRMLCREQGASLAVSEMVTSNKQLWHSRKTQLRLDHTGESSPRSVQIAGTDPAQMAEAAQYNVENGAQIIDINMGCPAKKVCNVMAGSALLRNESLVANILHSVVNAVDVPVTLKIRTGWDLDNRNAISIAAIAEAEGIQALTIHGRTRACAFKGEAEYETIAEVKSRIQIPVIANGDIDSPEKAVEVLRQTGADALMIGRGAQGRPWIFKEILHYLEHGKNLPSPDTNEVNFLLNKHLKNLYDFYGETMGVRIARKHIGWYCKHLFNQSVETNSDIIAEIESFRNNINKVESTEIQLEKTINFFTRKGSLLAA
ncbi:MAG: tRNA dihydrouridine synthase DusB [Gammaproteobacteria bacterium]|nr:tRNA dihydrouridine synthase DusB [Gammaproteobacteria bacterium]